MHYRKTYEVVGYAYDGELYCLDCFGDPSTHPDEGYGPNPVSLGDCEGEGEDRCGECGEALDA